MSIGAARRVRVVGDQRLLVVAAVLVATAVKLYWAANTAGTNDVHNFQAFAGGARQWGPIGMYGHHMVTAPYNHPPLIGWLLVVINWLTDHGLPFRFLIRLPATFADVVTTLLVYQLVRSRSSVGQAVLAGAVFALSPVLLVISGFHGNTDPVFVMFAVLSFFLLYRYRSVVTGALAGLSFAAAISVKLVPIVVLPVLLLVAARSGVRRLVAFLAASGALFALLWGPVVAQRWVPFKRDVLQYAGYYGVGGHSTWGLPQFGYALNLPHGVQNLLIGSGRFVVLLLCAGVPALLAWRRPGATVPAFGLTLSMFLLLSTAFATQYLAWAVASTFLIGPWSGVAYTVVAGALLVKVYDRWNGAYPWRWNNGVARGVSHREIILAGGAWLVLLVIVVAALWRIVRHPDGRLSGAPEADRSTDDVSRSAAAAVPG